METIDSAVPTCAEKGTTRRSFYVGAIYTIWAVISAALGAPAALYLLLAPKTRTSEQWIDAGNVSKLAAGQPVEMVFRRNRTDGWKVVSEKGTAWVVKTPDENVVAFGPQCTHLGCAHHWDDKKNMFVCPCHNSLFSIDGSVSAGPAPRPLDRYEVKVEGSRLLLGGLRQSREHTA